MPHTYMVKCSDGTLYVGSTVDLERRIGEHNAGLGAAYTRSRRPVQLVWCAFSTRIDDAFAFEKQIQGWSRAKRLALIEGRTGDLSGLASRSWADRQARGALKPGEPGGPPRP